ncbi:MAG TPA: hypothetical protein VKB69_08210 [Micromonosporaceae bacterium]|nr:hypothetical protein [Micromonosporaceae bacterium]
MTAGAGGPRLTRLDDLLSYDEPRRRRGRSRPPWVRLLGRFVVGMIPATILWELLRHNGVGVSFPLLTTIVAALACLKALLDALAPEPLPATLRDLSPRTTPRVPPEDGIRTASWRWELRLEWTYDDLPRFATIVQQAIADLVNERLRLRHSLTLKDDPERARELVGPQLWAFINEPVDRAVKPHELAALITKMEQL